MERSKPYTIHFDYAIVEESMTCHLRGIVIVSPDDLYTIEDIRLAGNGSGSLIPPVILIRQNGSWVYADSKRETALSLAIGKAIDAWELNSAC